LPVGTRKSESATAASCTKVQVRIERRAAVLAQTSGPDHHAWDRVTLSVLRMSVNDHRWVQTKADALCKAGAEEDGFLDGCL
jgi:hypothetical protein